MSEHVDDRLEAARDRDWLVTPPNIDDIYAARRRHRRRITSRAVAAAVLSAVVLFSLVAVRNRQNDGDDAVVAAGSPAANNTQPVTGTTQAPSATAGTTFFVPYTATSGPRCLVLSEAGENFRACNLLPGPSMWKIRGQYYLLQDGSLDYDGRRLKAPSDNAVVVRLPSHDAPDVVPLKERGTRAEPDPTAACFSPSVADALAARYPWAGAGEQTGYPFITVSCTDTAAQVAMAGPTANATLTKTATGWVAS